MDINYRSFEDKDEPEVLRLLNEFCDYYIEIDDMGLCINPPELPGWCLGKLKEAIHNNRGKLIVAEYEGKLIGYTCFVVKEASGDELIYHRKNKYGKIYDVYVDKDFRGKGIGSQLMQFAEDYFKDHKCETIRLTCLGPNKTAYAIYEKRGYKPRDIEMFKKMP